MRKQFLNSIPVVLLLVLLSGCVGGRTFHELARAGDTVAVAAGWKHYYRRDNITVTITPSSGSPIVLPPGDPSVRAIINLYPDPVSSLVVSQETRQDLTTAAQQYAGLVNSSFTRGDKDWWQTSVFVDLPATIPPGIASIEINNPQNEYVYSEVEIVAGVGRANAFYASSPLNDNQLASMERVGHYTVRFSGSTIPHAIQLDLVHDPDVDHGGAGRAHVANARGDLKGLAWKDDGSNMRVLLTSAKTSAPVNMKDFKIYVAGGITGLQVVNVKAVDSNGNPVPGVTAIVTQND